MGWLLGHFVSYIKEGVVWVVQQCINTLGAWFLLLLNALPPMPSQPSLPSFMSDAISWAYYLFDFGWLLAYLTTFFGLIAALFLLMIALRWAKVID